MTLKINLKQIYERIYAESAWRAAHRNDVYTLTPDNEELLRVKVKSGFDELVSKISGYLNSSSFDPTLARDNIKLDISFEEIEPVIDSLRSAIIETLAFYALLQFYGLNDNYYDTAWRRNRAHVCIILCRAELARD